MDAQQRAAEEAARFVGIFNDVILFPVIALLSGIALLFFMYGSAVYIMNADNDQAREQGKKNIIYGIVGLVIMVSAYAILTIASGTFGLNRQLDCAANPTASGCANVFTLPSNPN